MSNLNELTIAGARDALRKGDTTAVALTEALSFRAPLEADVPDEGRWLLRGLDQVFDCAGAVVVHCVPGVGCEFAHQVQGDARHPAAARRQGFGVAVALVLGASYVGWQDDLAVFDRALSDAEVEQVFRLGGGIGALR